MDNQIEREQQLFSLCVDEPAHEWEHILEQHCDDTELRERVRRLLVHHQTVHNEAAPLQMNERDPERIGPYRILQRLGEGGMGLVYAAEQREPVRRRVAVKVLRVGHNSREVLARFDAERQALALMNHPNIARILDAGTTADHRPYIVMEYVPGEPITRYCVARSLPLGERLQLFRDVCEAIQHAHQKGIIHRDIKPSNILVMEENGRAVAKVIDFGIAKAVSQRLTDHTLETKVGSLLGTPDYMSPEQAELTPLDVDTRADVYALGAVLYHILTGVPPLELAGSGMSYSEMQRVICEQEPLAASLKARSENVRVPRELDWITLKALEKDRNRRYVTAAAFGDDIARFLSGDAPAAGPQTVRYRASKFIRRHALAAGAVGSAFLLIMTFAILMTWQVRQTALERDRANLAAQNAEQVTTLLAEIFAAVNPDNREGTELSVGSLLRRGRQRISNDPDLPPAVRSRLLSVIGDAFLKQGYFQDAAGALRESLQSIPHGEAETVTATIATYVHLAGASQESGDLQGAKKILLDAQQAITDFQLEGTDAETSVMNALGLHHLFKGEYDQAIELLERVRERYRTQKGERHERTLSTQFNLALAYQDAGDAEHARLLLEQTEESARHAFGPQHSLIGEVAMTLGNLARHDGDIESARTYYRTAIENLSYLQGHDSNAALLARIGLAMSYRGDPQGTDLLLKVYTDSERLLGRDSITTLIAAANLSDFLSDSDEYTRAFPIAQHAYSGFSETLGDEHPSTQEVAFLFAAIAANAGHPEQALQVLPVALRSDKWRAKIESDRRFDSLRDSPEFVALLRTP